MAYLTSLPCLLGHMPLHVCTLRSSFYWYVTGHSLIVHERTGRTVGFLVVVGLESRNDQHQFLVIVSDQSVYAVRIHYVFSTLPGLP